MFARGKAWSASYAGPFLIDERLAAGWAESAGATEEEEEEEEGSESGDEGILMTICARSDRLACPKARGLSSEYASFVVHAQ